MSDSTTHLHEVRRIHGNAWRSGISGTTAGSSSSQRIGARESKRAESAHGGTSEGWRACFAGVSSGVARSSCASVVELRGQEHALAVKKETGFLIYLNS